MGFDLKRSLRLLCTCLAVVAATPMLLAQSWTERGPGPILNGQSEGIPTNPVSGAINAIVQSPADVNTIYVGAVNGGVWKTTNATAATPTWTPLTDLQLPALSINSLAINPGNPNVIFAGTGSTSADAFEGDPGFGVAKSIDGGNTWSVFATATFDGRAINSLATPDGTLVLASTLFDKGGVYRSTDGGVTFTRISGSFGLPDAGVSRLVGDPGNASRFYAAVPSSYVTSGTPGVYRSDNGGATWTPASTDLTATNSVRILLSVGAGGSAVYAAVLSTAGGLANVYRSTNQGGTWTAMGVPSPNAFPGGQGIVHGAIVADPTDPNIVFLAGDRQNSPFPNANGCTNFSASAFRGDASLLPATPWQNIVCNGANGTSPHADARVMVFDSSGQILAGNDGGLYRLVAPNNSVARIWTPLQGNVRVTELHSVAFDPVSHVSFGGAQDVGTPMQVNGFTWNDFLQGDGGNVAVDADQTAHPGTSIRYSSFQNLGFFNRSTWSNANTFVSLTAIPLQITSGPGTGLTIFQFDPNIQFYNPYGLNAVNPSRMLIGTANIYESVDKGDHLSNLGFLGAFVQSLAYGGRFGGVPMPDVFYVATTSSIFHRVTPGPLSTLAIPPGASTPLVSIVMDPQNYKQVFVADSQGHVFGSSDEGATWTNLTANLPSLAGEVTALEVFNTAPTPLNQVLIAAGENGVFQMRRPGAAGAAWTVLGTALPHTLVMDVHYNYACDVLVAGLLGRGAWTISGAFRGASTAACPPTVSIANTGSPVTIDVQPPPPQARVP